MQLQYHVIYHQLNYNAYFRLSLFLVINISQGSVAIHLRCGGYLVITLLQTY